MKTKEVSFNEQLEEAVGHMVLSIGKGDFTATAKMWLAHFNSRGFDKGVKSVKPIRRKARAGNAKRK